jgi:hypothetical protein
MFMTFYLLRTYIMSHETNKVIFMSFHPLGQMRLGYERAYVRARRLFSNLGQMATWGGEPLEKTFLLLQKKIRIITCDEELLAF